VTRGRLIAGAVALLGLAVLLVLAVHPPGAHGSSLSRGPDGLLAARAYLEARGAPVELIDRAEPEPGDGVVVEAFPWQRRSSTRAGFLRAHLAAGGDLVLAYSGGFDFTESKLFDELGMPLRMAGDDRFLPPATADAAELELIPVPAPGRPPPPVAAVPSPGWLPRPPKGARPLYRIPSGEAAAFIVRRAGGRVVVLPAAALDNAGLLESGNADQLESLRTALSDRWRFDEYVHGLTGPAAAGSELPRRVIELVAAHLLVLYLLALLAVARRFGPPWREPPVVTGSTVAFPSATASAVLSTGGTVELAGVELFAAGDGVVAVGADGTPRAAHESFWFAWSQFHPDTRLWEAPAG
jgi:hypothetical protein